jgi:hypothetical protein
MRSIKWRLGQLRRGAVGFVIGAAVFAAGATVGMAPAMAQGSQITLIVHEIKLIDRADAFSQADLFVRATIAGQTKVSPPMKQTGRPGESIRNEITLSQAVKPGRHAVRLELLDKDLRADDFIDINRIANRRFLDFTVDTRNCRIAGFAQAYRCKQRITRAGAERKAAEITFSVEVRK